MHSALSILLALPVTTAASAANLTFIADCGGSQHIRSYSFDEGSLRHDGRNLLVRVNGDYSRDRGSRATNAQILWSFDCEDRTFVERSRTEYGADGTVIASYTSPTRSMGIKTGSVANELLKKVCG